MTWSVSEAAADQADTYRTYDVVCKACECETYVDTRDLRDAPCPMCKVEGELSPA